MNVEKNLNYLIIGVVIVFLFILFLVIFLINNGQNNSSNVGKNNEVENSNTGISISNNNNDSTNTEPYYKAEFNFTDDQLLSIGESIENKYLMECMEGVVDINCMLKKGEYIEFNKINIDSNNNKQTADNNGNNSNGDNNNSENKNQDDNNNSDTLSGLRNDKKSYEVLKQFEKGINNTDYIKNDKKIYKRLVDISKIVDVDSNESYSGHVQETAYFMTELIVNSNPKFIYSVNTCDTNFCKDTVFLIKSTLLKRYKERGMITKSSACNKLSSDLVGICNSLFN